MSVCCAGRGGGQRELTFGMLAQQVFSLDSAIDWALLD